MATRSPSTRSAPTEIRDHYQEVTDAIIAALEQGVIPWRRPWTPAMSGRSVLPPNAVTHNRYGGINVLLLALSPFAWSSGDSRWCSYKQAAGRGWQVRRGETGTRIFFFKRLEVPDTRPDLPGAVDGKRRIPMLRAYTVFHASQIEDVPTLADVAAEQARWRTPDGVNTIVHNSGVEVRIGGSEAYYRPDTDHIQMPPPASFRRAEDWSTTILHELAHASGAPHRLDRELSTRYGTERYQHEELVAELASAFIGAELGLPSDVPNHASYIGGFLDEMRRDKREIFRAAAQAQRAADWCLNCHPDYRAARVLADTDGAGEGDDPSTVAAEAASDLPIAA